MKTVFILFEQDPHHGPSIETDRRIVMIDNYFDDAPLPMFLHGVFLNRTECERRRDTLLGTGKYLPHRLRIETFVDDRTDGDGI